MNEMLKVTSCRFVSGYILKHHGSTLLFNCGR